MTDLIGIFNADSRKSVSEFLGLRWLLVFEDLCNGASKKYSNLNLKQWVYNFQATASFFNFLSFKKKNQFFDLFIFITQKYDDSITTYFIFSKRQFTKKKMCVYIMHVKFCGSFSDLTIFICNLVYKFDTFKNC